MPRFSLISEQLIVLNTVRVGTGRKIVPLAVEGPYDYGRTEGAFGVRTTRTERENRISFSLTDAQLPFLTQNNVMWSYLEPEFNLRLAELAAERTFATTVEAALYSAIPGNRFAREEVARSLGVSVRTMQRKLNDSGTTYAQLVQRVQMSLAESCLRLGELSLGEVSCLVGYREQSSFSRAFKGWTGQTVSEYRAAARLEA